MSTHSANGGTGEEEEDSGGEKEEEEMETNRKEMKSTASYIVSIMALLDTHLALKGILSSIRIARP
jgi:hypothetical protein